MDFSDCPPGEGLWLYTQGLEPPGLDDLLRRWPRVRKATTDGLPEGARGVALVDAAHPAPAGFRQVRAEADAPWVLAALERILKGILAPEAPPSPPPLPLPPREDAETAAPASTPASAPVRGAWKAAAHERGRLRRGRRPVRKR